jgi:hypothetical protein
VGAKANYFLHHRTKSPYLSILVIIGCFNTHVPFTRTFTIRWPLWLTERRTARSRGKLKEINNISKGTESIAKALGISISELVKGL